MKDLIDGKSPSHSRINRNSAYVDGTSRFIEGRQHQNNHNLSSYTAHAEQEIEQLFPVLPNPKIKIYVYPHMATHTRAPVPGYVTAVSLYERDEYALPNEMTRARIASQIHLPQKMR